MPEKLVSVCLEETGYRGLKEVDPRTMASKCCSGLYLAGEVLDLQADTGEYNLLAAFSTGWLAALLRSIAWIN